ncbi:Uma2 family endonuclease [Alienimonas chondri]|uniref:Putative restriction endonuclease domain-containing protein n=1 Tax=Alienimonas chondri TaxID=2681879 RepID=A0ABX1VA58_9PLAN|nr:Uma2 family endonuclease [Alienimonas chondri]NNJ24757.1 hypothetical protein [Alienimonas chondri]
MSVASPESPATPADWSADPRNDGPPDLLTGFRFPAGHVLGPEDEGKLISREEFCSLHVLEPWKAERVAGRLEFMPPPGRSHRVASGVFRHALMRYFVARNDLVEDFESERWALVGDDGERQGDAAVMLRDSPLAGASDDFTDPARAPDVYFEVVSPGSRARQRDYADKRADYHRIGVREYVIVDPIRRRVTVLRHEPAGYVEAATLGPEDSYSSPLLPGLSIPLAEALGGDG